MTVEVAVYHNARFDYDTVLQYEGPSPKFRPDLFLISKSYSLEVEVIDGPEMRDLKLATLVAEADRLREDVAERLRDNSGLRQIQDKINALQAQKLVDDTAAP